VSVAPPFGVTTRRALVAAAYCSARRFQDSQVVSSASISTMVSAAFAGVVTAPGATA